jgi:syntaxin 5
LPPHLRNNPLYTQRSSSAPPTSPTGAHPEPRFEYLSLDDEEETSLKSGTNQADNPYANQQQQALMQEDTSAMYLESRSTAIETIESTIAELGGIFQQLAQMVSEQRESVQRIDANTEDVVMNVDRAQYEIARYWRRVSGNRMLMVKIFGILILFFLLFVMLR